MSRDIRPCCSVNVTSRNNPSSDAMVLRRTLANNDVKRDSPSVKNKYLEGMHFSINITLHFLKGVGSTNVIFMFVLPSKHLLFFVCIELQILLYLKLVFT